MSSSAHPTTRTTVPTDRAAGVLLAQACGDALGVPYEFSSRLTADEVPQMIGGGLGPYAPGEYSDDTQMAACIAQVSATGADLTDPASLDQIAEGFLRWRARGATDIGNQTRAVLTSAAHGGGTAGERLRSAAAAYAARNPRSAGNGALMRTSIVGLTCTGDRDVTAAAARAVAELTHADPLAGDSCVLWSEAVRLAATEHRLDLTAGLDLLPAERRDAWSGWIADAQTYDPGQFTPNGFTVTALQAAWAAIAQTPVPDLDPAGGSFPCLHLQHALATAVRIGDDTDTVAAIAGGPLGAYWGSSAVPARWRRIVHGWPGARARQLAGWGILTATGGRPDTRGWPLADTIAVPMARDLTVTHPHDDGVLLGTVTSPTDDADAVVSLCRVGAAHSGPERLEIPLIDTDDPAANPNLDFVLADTADVIADLRAEGRRVLVHCVAAEQRTPSVALAYARRIGVPADDAASAVRAAVPGARARGRLWQAAQTVSAEGS